QLAHVLRPRDRGWADRGRDLLEERLHIVEVHVEGRLRHARVRSDFSGGERCAPAAVQDSNGALDEAVSSPNLRCLPCTAHALLISAGPPRSAWIWIGSPEPEDESRQLLSPRRRT